MITESNSSLVTYAEKIAKAECLIDFSTPGEKLVNKIRAFNPYPAMYFMYHNERFKVLAAQVVHYQGRSGEILEGKKSLIIALKQDALEIKIIQREGKQAMNTIDLLRGFTFNQGEIL